MARFVSSAGMRRWARLAVVALCATALVECGESGRYGVANTGGGTTGGTGGTGGTGAGIATASILSPAKTPGNTPVNFGDTVLVQFRVTSAKGIVSVDLRGAARRGNPAIGTDTLVDRYVERTVTVANKTDTTLTRQLLPIFTDSTTEQVLIVATAKDSAGNTGSDTTTVFLALGPKASLTRPADSSVSTVGKSVTVEVHASSSIGLTFTAWRSSGSLTKADTLRPGSCTAPSRCVFRPGKTLPDTMIFIDTLRIPAGTPTGALTITAFAKDSAGNTSGSTKSITVLVQSAASDITPPLVTFTVQKRVEVDDSVTVHATDPGGIAQIGFFVRPVGNTTTVSTASQNFSGNQTDVTAAFRLNLDTVTTFPRLVTIEAFAVDSVGNRGLSSFTTTPVAANGTAALDTITIVAGKTFALPAGGEIADGIYNRNRNELYLTNILLNRIEVFQVGTSTFLAGGIPVGSRPLGIALWPRDTLGSYADTVIVANSGGTNLSIVDVFSRTERRRHRLPDYLIEKIKTATDPANGSIVVNITQFDYSDRPQYVGAVCRANCANVFAVYSTTPTGAQAQPDHGYMAWEELTAPASAPNGHFFWETATGPASLATDTLQVIAVRDTAPGQFRRDTLLGGAVGIVADFNQLVVQDTTFVRNSGDFNHAVMGEGGGASLTFARAFSFDARSGTQAITGTSCSPLLTVALSCNGIRDNGVSEGIFVRDFLTNRASRVRSIATNFNGRTNFVRADSIYVMDFLLGQAGLIQVGGQNPGMDVNPNNNFDARTRGSNFFGGTGSPNNRLLYAARPDANIEVFDTYWYASVALIPVRDPIIGPVRLALNIVGQQVLVGVTANGVVVVPLTTPIANPLPIRAAVRQP